MRKIITLFFFSLSSFFYSQEQRFVRYDLFCEAEIFDVDSNRWVVLQTEVIGYGCYGFFMNESQQMIMMKSYNDSTDTCYEIIETKSEFLHWTYKSLNISTKELVYFNYYRSVPDENEIYYYDILRLDFPDHSIRYRNKQN
jgi:hypothetical protein